MSGRRPGRLRAEREQRAGQAAEGVGFGTCRGERKADASRGLDDTVGDFQETKMQRRELGSGQFPGFGNGVAHGKHQPKSGGDLTPASAKVLCPFFMRKAPWTTGWRQTV